MKIATIVALTLLVMAGSAMAEQKYPPYPDVWERKLPISRKDDSTAQTDIYPGPDGDMLAYQVFLIGDWRTAAVQFRRISFFSGQDVPVTEKELKRQRKKSPGPVPRTGGMRLEFPDGYVIRNRGYPSYLFGTWGWCMNIPLFAKYNYNNMAHDEVRKTFIRLLQEEEEKESIDQYCKNKNIPTTYRTRIRFPYPETSEYYVLADRTFLTVFDSDYLVRFDRNLNSPFIDNHPDIFAVDAEQIEPIMAEASRREAEEPGFNAMQFFHDRVTELVMSMQKPAPR